MAFSRLITPKIALAATLSLYSWGASASPLDLLLGTPDIVSGFITVGYDAAGDTLTASGAALQLYDGSAETPIDGGSFELEATIDASGSLVFGTVTIGGTIAGLGHTSGTLLTGVLTDFGFGGLDSSLEFLFATTGGDLMSLYGEIAGIILSQAGFPGGFDADFSGTTAVSDTAAIPLPGAVWLMLSALAGLAGMRKRG